MDKLCVRIKLCRDPTPEKSDIYEFKISLFDNGEPEEFLLFIRDFNITFEASGQIIYGVNIQYLCTMICGEVLRQVDMFSAEVVNTTSEF